MSALFETLAPALRRLVGQCAPDAVPALLQRELKAGSIKKILLIQLQQLGDNLIYTPVLRALTERFRDRQVDMLVNSVGYEVFKHVSGIGKFYVDASWYWGKGERRLLPLFKLLRHIRREQYDLAVLDASGAAFKYPAIAWMTGARHRLGFDVNSRGFLNTLPVRFDVQKTFLENNLTLLSALGMDTLDLDRSLWLPTSAADKRAASELLEKFGITPQDKLVVLHQGSNYTSKQWFPERWAELGARLLSDPHVKLVLTGAPRETPDVEALLAALNRLLPDPPALNAPPAPPAFNAPNASGRIHSAAGRTGIHSLKEILEEARLFITIDTGPMHIGSAAKTKMLVLMSAIDREDSWIHRSERVSLIRKEVECKYCLAPVCPLGTKECMRLISVEEVYQEAIKLLSVPHPA